MIAGQGTVALEMLDDAGPLDAIVVPVGGGGLISGVALAAKARHPDIEIVGVQVEAFGPVAATFDHLPPTGVSNDTLADGIAVKYPGALNQAIIGELVDDVVLVSEQMTERAIGLYLEIEKAVAEGAGAVSLAAVLADRERFAGRRVGLVLSGGNVDSRVLASVLMRSLVRTDRISTLRIEVGDIPGQLAPILATVAEVGANLVEVDHRRLFDPISARRTTIELVVETRDGAHLKQVMEAIEDQGCPVERVDG